MKKIYGVFFLLFLMTRLYGQKPAVDSLLHLLETSAPDTNRVNILVEITKIFITDGLAERAGQYMREADSLSKKLNYIKGEADVLTHKGWLYYRQSKYQKSIATHFSAINLRAKIGDRQGIAGGYNSIALTYIVLGDFPEAMNYLELALTINKELNYLPGINNNTINMGLVYNKLGNYPEAIKYYLSSLKVSEIIGDMENMARCYNNIGYVNFLNQDYDESFRNYQEAFKIYLTLKNKSGISIIYDNMGHLYKEQDDFTRAAFYFKSSLKLKKEIGDKREIADSYRSLGEMFYIKGNYTEAITSCFIALNEFREEGVKSEQASVYYLLGQIYKATGKLELSRKYLDSAWVISKQVGEKDLIKKTCLEISILDSIRSGSGNYTMSERLSYSRNAHAFFKEYVVYRDSLNNDENTKKIVQSKMQFDFEKKEAATRAEHEKRELLSQAKVKQEQFIRNSTLAGVGILGLFSFLYLGTYNRKRRATFEKQVAEVETKALRSQMNPHFIFNSLNSIDDYILNNDIKNSSLYVNKFSRLMRLILESSRKEEVSVKEDLESLQLYIQLENLRMTNKVECMIEVDPEINTENTLIPPMLLQPFIENSFKHAFHGIENPKLEINVSLKNEMLYCTVTDNGTGRGTVQNIETETNDKRQSLGLTVTRERLDIISKIKKSKAYFAFEDLMDSHQKASGTRVLISVPASFSF